MKPINPYELYCPVDGKSLVALVQRKMIIVRLRLLRRKIIVPHDDNATRQAGFPRNQAS